MIRAASALLPYLPALACLLWLPVPAAAQQAPLGAFQGQADVGAVGRPGSATFDPVQQSYTVSGSGTNMWFDKDQFHLVWKRMRGDFILRTRADLVGEGVDPHRKAGWIARSTLDDSAPYVSAAVHGDGLAALQFRRAPGGQTEEVRSGMVRPDMIQLERSGNRFIMSVAHFGDPLRPVQASEVELGDEVYVGLFVSAHNNDVVERAVFRGVRIIEPAPENFTPYRDYLGSNVELLDVLSGDRRIVYRSPGSVQAPNWTPDGEALIYNYRGRLYRFDLDRRTPELIDTEFANGAVSGAARAR
jgi:TolB protein